MITTEHTENTETCLEYERLSVFPMISVVNLIRISKHLHGEVIC